MRDGNSGCEGQDRRISAAGRARRIRYYVQLSLAFDGWNMSMCARVHLRQRRLKAIIAPIEGVRILVLFRRKC